MNRKTRDYFIFSVAVILFVAAVAKIFSATGTAKVLGNSDPLILLSNRQVFYLAGGIELFISAFLLMKHEAQMAKLLLIAWLATNYLLYRLGLLWLDAPNFFDCLGNLNEKLPLSPPIVYHVMLVILAWLTMGSYLLLLFDWLGRRKASGSSLQSS